MKKLKYLSNSIQFLKSCNSKPKKENQINFELSNTRFEINLTGILKANNVTNSNLLHMYSRDNETLFI